MVAGILAALLILLTAPSAFAQTAEVLRGMDDSVRLGYMAGFMDALALSSTAAERTAAMHKCAAGWGPHHVRAVFDKWIDDNPRERQLSARVSLFSAIANACGWKRGQ